MTLFFATRGYKMASLQRRSAADASSKQCESNQLNSNTHSGHKAWQRQLGARTNGTESDGSRWCIVATAGTLQLMVHGVASHLWRTHEAAQKEQITIVHVFSQFHVSSGILDIVGVL
jgi:hypothetical protein